MRVEPEWRECVAFICERIHGKTKPGGTAFFVRVPDESRKDLEWTYVVTARHCIEDAIKTPDGEIFIRIISIGPNFEVGYKDIPTHWEDWFCHRAEHADVAVIPLITDEEPTLRIRRMPPTFIGLDRLFAPTIDVYGVRSTTIFKEQVPQGVMTVEVGDDLFFPGLFVQSAGRNRLLPVVRFGNIARIGNERIEIQSRTRGKIEIDACLAECHSFGGFSGSPVVWHYVLNVQNEIEGASGSKHRVISERLFYRGLLGLVSGHFGIEAKSISKKTSKPIDNLATQVNSGFAVITPAEHIRYLVMKDERVVKDRKDRSSRSHEDQQAAVADYASGGIEEQQQLTHAPKPEDRIRIPILTRESVIRDLTKATRKRNKK